ncbi:MAG: hypothetical protein BWK80_55535 [Desulfobacteraceae bacterium IS3]|nr:MAG: hypothetical protein BWK80_55535 [Desulfobacteraceae bacterium IS3]
MEFSEEKSFNDIKGLLEEAREFFRERFPGQELSEKVAGLIGILYQGEDIPEKLYNTNSLSKIGLSYRTAVFQTAETA